MASTTNNPRWPDDSVQSFVGTWWERDPDPTPKRGALGFAWIPHAEQVPKEIVPEGRDDPRDHSRFRIRVRPFDGHHRPDEACRELPVASMTLQPGEILLGFTARLRPVLVVSEEPSHSAMGRRRGNLLVAPYYEFAERGAGTSFPSNFIDRVRTAEYASYLWDRLPMATEESILRLDCIQPVARSNAGLRMSGWRLTEHALNVVEDWFVWLRRGKLPASSDLLQIRNALRDR